MLTQLVRIALLSLAIASPDDVQQQSRPHRTSVAVVPYTTAVTSLPEIPLYAEECIRAELAGTGRWDLYLDPRSSETRRRIRVATMLDVADAVRAGRALGVEKVVTGQVTSADANVRKSESRKSTTYTLTATVTVRHVMVDVATGRPEREEVITASSRDTSASPPSRTLELDHLRRACADTARRFVRMLVPAVEGKVLAKIPGKDMPLVLVSLGRGHGVGTDHDWEFYRLEPILDENGAPVIKPDGEKATALRKVAAIMRPDHKKPTPCVGHARTVHEDTAELEVGYYRGEFLGRRFEARKPAVDAIEVGDIVRPVARPTDVP